MRRLGAFGVVLILAIFIQTAACFAGTLEIVSSYPKDGGTGYSPINCAVKIYFNQDVSSEAYRHINDKCFEIRDPENKTQPITVLYDSKNKEMVLVVLNGILESDTEYRLLISGEFTAASGDTLDNFHTITFRTRDQAKDTNTSMLMMIVMFAGIFAYSARQMKKQAQKAEEEKDKSKVNPYKVSKKTGKSVVEIVEKTEKEKRKKAALEAKLKADRALIDEEYGDEQEEEYEENDNKRVKGPRPISAAGSKYKSGKKAKAAAVAKKKAAAGTTKPKNQSGKDKNKKRR